MEEQCTKKRLRDDSGELEFDSAEVKRLREDLLFILDDSVPDQETQEGLFSVIKSFEEEISALSSPSPPVPATAVVDLSLESGESQPELGFLLGASDDELGLPPTAVDEGVFKGGNEETGLARVDSVESVGIDELWGGEGELPNYDAFELGAYEATEYGGDVVDFGEGLFDYSDVVYDGSEFSDFSRRLGSMPAE